MGKDPSIRQNHRASRLPGFRPSAPLNHGKALTRKYSGVVSHLPTGFRSPVSSCKLQPVHLSLSASQIEASLFFPIHTATNSPLGMQQVPACPGCPEGASSVCSPESAIRICRMLYQSQQTLVSITTLGPYITLVSEAN